MKGTTTLNQFNSFGEASKALLEMVLGTDLTNQLVQNELTYSDLVEQNKVLKEEVASLKENLSFRDKYENLSKEFRKVASERDILRARELEMTRIRYEYDRLKSEYQSAKGQLATLRRQIEEINSSMTLGSALEILYLAFKEQCLDSGVDIHHLKCELDLQFELQDKSDLNSNFKFIRTTTNEWQEIDESQPSPSNDGDNWEVHGFGQ